MRLLGVWYKQLALFFFTGAILFLGLNFAAGAAFRLKDRLTGGRPGSLSYGLERLRRAYPGWSDKDMERLLTETWKGLALEYRPFVAFKEGEFHGAYVNTSRDGFRQGSARPAWPPAERAVNIFVFGGSTTFGYGVADGETIPAAMQEVLSSSCSRTVAVYNFGGAWYSSSQEAALFMTLLRSGAHPDLAVFIDGLNEGVNHEPPYTIETQRLFHATESRDWRSGAGLAAAGLPVVRAVQSLGIRLGIGRSEVEPPPSAAGAATRWRANRRLIAALAQGAGARTLFVWQPAPSYKYDRQYHFLNGTGFEQELQNSFLERLYPLVQAKRPDLEGEGNFLWLADMQENRKANFYVDAEHYNPGFCREIAAQICAFLQARQLACRT